jgi:hypothetical protein
MFHNRLKQTGADTTLRIGPGRHYWGHLAARRSSRRSNGWRRNSTRPAGSMVATGRRPSPCGNCSISTWRP